MTSHAQICNGHSVWPKWTIIKQSHLKTIRLSINIPGMTCSSPGKYYQPMIWANWYHSAPYRHFKTLTGGTEETSLYSRALAPHLQQTIPKHRISDLHPHFTNWYIISALRKLRLHSYQESNLPLRRDSLPTPRWRRMFPNHTGIRIPQNFSKRTNTQWRTGRGNEVLKTKTSISSDIIIWCMAKWFSEL